jgi:hypothetical protein
MDCPHCGAQIPGVEAHPARSATTVVMGLTLAGCIGGDAQPAYGTFDDGSDWTATSGSTTTDDSTTASTTAMEGSATSDEATSSSTDTGTDSSAGDTSDTDTDTDTEDSTGDSSTTDETGTSVGEPEYGVPDTGDEPLYGAADAG